MELENILKGIKNVTCDSRSVKPGDLFIALNGYKIDGYTFIKDAIAKGARVIVAEKDFAAPEGVKKILVDDARIILPLIADKFYDHPSEKLKVVGVTGTNGKTTITYLIENIIKKAGHEAGVIGTINYRMKGKILPAKNTTPGALDLQAMLASMVDKGIDHAVMEVSSHALDQHRVDGVSFDAAIFTNITSEHMDYHKNIDNYFQAKVILFSKLKKQGSAILNNDDPRVTALKKSLSGKVLTYGVKKGADVTAKDIRLSLDGSEFTIVMPKGEFQVKAKLIGSHNVSNILAAAAAAMAIGMDKRAILKGIESTSFVPGRLEAVEAGQPFKVFVDYAHTEDALYNVLGMIRELTKEKIVTVFGCGGDRDRTKRPCMGKVACKFSDRVVITSDNPRFEDPGEIIKEIEDGIRSSFTNYEVVADRRDAIRKALSIASDGDIVIIAGKGHEDYQIVRDKILSFDDRIVAKELLQEACPAPYGAGPVNKI